MLIHSLGALGFITKDDEDLMLQALDDKGKLSKEEKERVENILSAACQGVEKKLRIMREQP